MMMPTRLLQHLTPLYSAIPPQTPATLILLAALLYKFTTKMGKAKDNITPPILAMAWIISERLK